MRLFAAAYPPAAALDRLGAALDRADAGLRWVPAHQWHITLAFYGDVPERSVAALTTRLERAARRTTAFELRLAGAGTFPHRPDRARQLWAGVAGDVDALRRLAERCVAAGRREGVAGESRRYRPHLTLARSRREPVDMTAHVTRLSAYGGEPWTVSGFTLVRSTLGAEVVHAPLAVLPLAAAAE